MQMRDRCLVSPVTLPEPCWGGRALLGWPCPAGVAVPCSLLMPTVALKVSSVLEGSMLFLALNPCKAKVQQGFSWGFSCFAPG